MSWCSLAFFIGQRKKVISQGLQAYNDLLTTVIHPLRIRLIQSAQYPNICIWLHHEITNASTKLTTLSQSKRSEGLSETVLGRRWSKLVVLVKATAKMSITRIEIPQITERRISEWSQRAKIEASPDQRKGHRSNLGRGSNENRRSSATGTGFRYAHTCFRRSWPWVCPSRLLEAQTHRLAEHIDHGGEVETELVLVKIYKLGFFSYHKSKTIRVEGWQPRVYETNMVLWFLVYTRPCIGGVRYISTPLYKIYIYYRILIIKP